MREGGNVWVCVCRGGRGLPLHGSLLTLVSRGQYLGISLTMSTLSTTSGGGRLRFPNSETITIVRGRLLAGGGIMVGDWQVSRVVWWGTGG